MLFSAPSLSIVPPPFFTPLLLLFSFVAVQVSSSLFLCGPQWFRAGRLYSVRTDQSKAEWGLLGLCQSQGSDWRYKSGWRDGGSWIPSVWPQLNTRSPIKRDAPDRSIKPPLPPQTPLLLTRSVNPSLNVRTHSVYGLNWQCWCAHSGVSCGKRGSLIKMHKGALQGHSTCIVLGKNSNQCTNVLFIKVFLVFI